MINVALLDRELTKAGIIHAGCNANGIVWGLDNTEIQTRPDVAIIVAAQPQTETPDDTEVLARAAFAKGQAQAIPSWATWTEAEALAWGEANIGTPLTTGRSNLPATLTLATARAAIIALLNILDKMWVLRLV